MSSSLANPTSMLAHIVFPVIALGGIYAVSSLMICSGHAQAFADSLHQVPFRLLPDGKTPLQLWYTGFGPLDSYLANLQLIFIPLVDGSSPELSLLGWHWAGLLLAVFAVMLVESLRTGHKRDLFFFALWGIAIQYCGYFVTMPVYCYVHILRSTRGPAPSSTPGMIATSSSTSADAVAVIRAIPFSMLLGYLLPSAVMSLSWIHSGQSRQLAVAFWQNFPAWIAAVQVATMWWMSRRSTILPEHAGLRPNQNQKQVHGHQEAPENSSQPSEKASLAQAEERRRSVRQVYRAAAVVSGLIHISGLAPVVLATLRPERLVALSPFRLNAASLQSLRATSFFLPPSWDSQVPISDLTEGARNFLRYDYYIGTVAALFWAAILQSRSHREEDVRTREANAGKATWFSSFSSSLGQLLMLVASVVVVGPGATVANLMRQRGDNLLENYRKKLL